MHASLLLDPHGDRSRKGRLNKACLAIIWLADCVQLASLPSGKKNNRRKKKTASQKVACLNVRTTQDSEDRHQRRSAFVVRELSELDIDIAAVSEARFAEQRMEQAIIIIINPLTARVVRAPQMILQPVFSIFPCSPLPSGTCRTPGLSIP